MKTKVKIKFSHSSREIEGIGYIDGYVSKNNVESDSYYDYDHNHNKTLGISTSMEVYAIVILKNSIYVVDPDDLIVLDDEIESILDKLQKLGNLKSQGILTQSEFETEKNKILKNG